MTAGASNMPTMRAGTKRRVRFFLVELCIIAVVGAVVGSVIGRTPLIGALIGALISVMVLGGIVGAEIFLPQTRLGQALERAPFLVTFAVKWLVYQALIVAVIGSGLVPWLVHNVHMLLGGDAAQAILHQGPSMKTGVLILMITLFVPPLILIVQFSRLIGERTLRDILLGRYHRSRVEERFFLFIDIVGSTPLAERIGPDAVHRFLNRVFQLASAPIDDHAGEVYQYVGDEVVITWTLAEGRVSARPLACYFAIERALAEAVEDFQREFGAVPRLRAALHSGPVITGVVGGSRRSIVFHGDVMNTTSRIENATRDLQRSFLASEDALNRLQGVEAYALADLGLQQLRGRAAPLRVYAVGSESKLPVMNPAQ